MSSWKWLPNLIFVICLINLFAIFRSEFPTTIFIKHECQNNRNGTSNITYKTNLNTLLLSASSNIDTNGFYNASIGENSDRVNVIALCRADLQPYQCRDYVKNATAEILKRCPNQDQAILWHEFCMVRYSNEAIYGTLAYSPFRWSYSKEKVRNQEKFYSALNILLDSLRNQTAYNSSSKKFAAASRAYEDNQPIYAFEQCTPDITPKECDDCVTKSTQQIRECCDGAAGVRILRPSCYLRFESDVFYNETMAETLLQPPTPPVQPPQVPAPAPGRENNTTRIVIIVTVPIVISLILALSIGIFLRTKKRRKPWENIQTDNETSTIESLQYDFGTIRTATDNFSDANKLGQGGFGVVYKGKLPKGNEIAVKRLSRDSGQGGLEFKNEVLLVARLQHRNLVRLLGFSVERSERLLIYEWVENGSLDRFIFDQSNHPYLDWEKRYIVIVGIARGLLYLHEDSRLQIIHRDLKASNILLDGEMNPKISDFGMAKLFVPNETQHSTSRIVGTYGYMAPEYVIHGQFSVKSDIFSFGVVVLEIICGQKTSNFRNNGLMEDLLSCVWKNWHEGMAANIIDPALRSSSRSLHDIMRCIHIGLLCVQENAADRPTMASVVLMLSSFSLTLPVPSQPAFFVSNRVDSELSVLRENDSSKDRSDNAAHLSANLNE